MAKPRLSYTNGAPSKAKRTTSGQFNQLSPSQIQELKEAFNLLDKDADGIVNEEDLEEMLVSLGRDPKDGEVQEMLNLLPQPLTFASFLTGMSSHLCDLSSKTDLLTAFSAFSNDDSGMVNVEDLVQELMSVGMSKEEARDSLEDFTVKSGFSGKTDFNYKNFVNLLRAD